MQVFFVVLDDLIDILDLVPLAQSLIAILNQGRENFFNPIIFVAPFLGFKPDLLH